MTQEAKITSAEVKVFTVPTDAPEADGTFAWESTTMVLVQLASGSTRGMGYTYGNEAIAQRVRKLLEQDVSGKDAFAHGAILQALYRAVRNDGVTGMNTMAISAIDTALWDLRACLAGLPLASLLGRVRDGIEVYGSGGFTSYSDAQLEAQLGGWVEHGFRKVKMKIGTHPQDDPRRVRVARKAIGPSAALFVDGNGAYTVSQALQLADQFKEQGVSWFEEPVSSDDLAGLRRVRDGVPAGMDVAAGEYGYNAWYYRRMIDDGAVSVVQADATRCAGFSGLLDVAALCWAANLPLSAHCGPSLHLHVCCAVPRAIHMEFFHDHARIERMFFDGFREPQNGVMRLDLTRPGMGLVLKDKDAAKYSV